MWTPEIVLHHPELPLATQLARAITADIRRGRLHAGERLPGSRTLAARLGVHRNTVLAAYRELGGEGWLVGEPGRGTRVAAGLLEEALPARTRQAGFSVSSPQHAVYHPPVTAPINLAEGHPDLAAFPAAALGRAWRSALLRQPRLLAYGDAQGHPSLRAVVAELLAATRGMAVTAEDVLITHGAQQALDLVARALIRPGDAVVVEALGYPPAWAALRAAGAVLLPVAVDTEGLDTEGLEAVLRTRPVRAIYVTPHHQYPTTATLSAARRQRLLGLARAYRVAVLEDDYDHEFHYDGPPVLPLASADPSGQVVYIGTLSKILAPGLRLGFVVAPPPLNGALLAWRRHADRQGDAVLEAAVATLLAEGDALRHVRRMTRSYRQRRDALALALAGLGDRVRFALPPGGLCLWVGIDGSGLAWEAAALRHGVAIRAGQRFSLRGEDLPWARLFFASTPPETLERAVCVLEKALP